MKLIDDAFDEVYAQQAWEAIRGFLVFILLMSILIGGALGVLVVLHYMEDINPALCVITLAVYAFTAVAAVVVGFNQED
jgi:hypothetical protein